MSERKLHTALFAALLCLAGNFAQAADPAPVTARQLMTQEEQLEQRNKMRAAKTEEERAAVRAENHQRMTERAEAQGKVLTPVNPQGPRTDAPRGPRMGQGNGPGAGRGPGMGPGMGQGMGAGQGAGRGRQ